MKKWCKGQAMKINNAEAVFITGGNQWNYISNWAGTALSRAIEHAQAQKAVIGGTSAGLHVLGMVDYSARNGGIDSIEALDDPFHDRITFNAEFQNDWKNQPGAELNLLTTTGDFISDSHFVNYDRMGRFLTFIAWSKKEGTGLPGFAVEEESAVLLETQNNLGNTSLTLKNNIGKALVVGSGKTPGKPAVAYFGKVTPGTTPTLLSHLFEGSFDIARVTRQLDEDPEDDWFDFSAALQTQVGYRYRMVYGETTLLAYTLGGVEFGDKYWGGQ